MESFQPNTLTQYSASVPPGIGTSELTINSTSGHASSPVAAKDVRLFKDDWRAKGNSMSIIAIGNSFGVSAISDSIIAIVCSMEIIASAN